MEKLVNAVEKIIWSRMERNLRRMDGNIYWNDVKPIENPDIFFDWLNDEITEIFICKCDDIIVDTICELDETEREEIKKQFFIQKPEADTETPYHSIIIQMCITISHSLSRHLVNRHNERIIRKGVKREREIPKKIYVWGSDLV